MTHAQAGSELAAGTPAELICAFCPWDRLCVEPPTLTKPELDKQIDEALKKDETRDPGHAGMPIGMLLTALRLGGRDGLGKLCPVFIARMRAPEGRMLADAVRTMMRGWPAHGRAAVTVDELPAEAH